MINKTKVAIVVSHPIQHFCPQYVSYSKLKFCEIKVFFGSPMGFKKYHDKSFGKEISWSYLGIEHFSNVFLNEEMLPADKNLDSDKLETELNDYSPDILISYGYFQKLQRRAQSWALNNKVPIAFISDSELRRKRNFLTSFIKKFYVRNQFKNINYFMSVGDANEMYYRHYGVKDRQLIRTPFPIDVELFENIYKNKEEYRLRFREKYGIEKNAIVLGVVGKIEQFKRQQDIITAISKLAFADKQVALLIIGTGPNSEALKLQSQSIKNCQIIFTGFIPPQELPGYYAAIDIYVHPSEKDAHSLSISEAIYMACPVLVSDRCGSYGPTDDVQEGKNGFVFETGNILTLTKTLKYLIEDHDMRLSFGKYSRQIGVHNQYIAHSMGLKALVELVKYNTLESKIS